ncbi:MAG TPA: SPOR domain-containing protein [Methylomirabilota bacterium]
MRYRHVWPGLLLLAALGLLLAGLVRWGDHFLSPGPTGGIHRLLQLWAVSRPGDELAAAPVSTRTASVDPAAPPPVSLPSMPSTAEAPASPGTSAVPAASPSADLTPVVPLPGATGSPPGAEIKTPTADRADETRAGAPPAPAPPPVRYALALGTFAVADDAERVETKLNQAGFSTVRFRQQASAKLFSVHVGSLKDADVDQATVERLQREGYGPVAVLNGRSGPTVRVGDAMPLRTAVQLAEKLRAADLDARVVAEATHAGQVSLRHGNFASRDEAEAASREIARLGVPNEVIQIR